MTRLEEIQKLKNELITYRDYLRSLIKKENINSNIDKSKIKIKN